MCDDVSCVHVRFMWSWRGRSLGSGCLGDGTGEYTRLRQFDKAFERLGLLPSGGVAGSVGSSKRMPAKKDATSQLSAC